MNKFLRLFCFVCVLVLLGGFVSSASAQSTNVIGVNWWTWPNQNNIPGQCKGNCGGGCGTSFGICGGQNGYWQLTINWWYFEGTIHESENFQSYWYDDARDCTEGYWYGDFYDKYLASGKWTYHGVYSNFCSNHDSACWGFWPYCILPADGLVQACIGAHAQDWSYDEWMHGANNYRREFIGWDCRPGSW